MEPLFLQPVFQEKIWGGDQLHTVFGFDIPNDKIGEDWAISGHPHGVSIVENGPYKGWKVSDLWNEHRELFGKAEGDVFPLLTKILDAEDDLSVQVHPDDSYGLKHEGELGKTECWYIINAKPGSEIVYGHNAKSREELAEMIENERWDDLLRRVPVKKGDFFYGYIEEMMDGQKVVKVFCHEEQAKKEFEVLNERLRDNADKANRYANLLMPVNANIGNLSYVLCAVAGGILALNGIGGITIGTIIAFVGLNKNFSQPITQISQQMNSVVMAAAGAGRVFELLDQKPEEDNGYVEFVNVRERKDGTLEETKERTGVWAWKHPHKAEGTVTYKKMEGGIVFDGVDFGYDPSKMVLHDIKLFAEPGQKIAFVGSTGAGKTTITNLINRFYDIQDGKIRYDGININKIKKPALRRSLGIVLQDTHLFTGTVMDNIRYGKLDATDEECVNAAKLANADSFINRLPHGYETVLTGDGGSLSQGQRQLLAIARAAVADPPVLILDEATSSIDTRTESLVQAGMDALMNGRTTFVIAHRLSTIRNADCIMVMEQGRIIERGSHEELIGRKGKYYQLYTGNFEEAG